MPEPGVTGQDDITRSRSMLRIVSVTVCATLIFACFTSLGIWQIQRLFWKRALIERVEQRVHAPAVAAPTPDNWSEIKATKDEYRHVSLSGIFLHKFTTPVKAVTGLGDGFWLLTPLLCADGSVVIINRGFIPTKEFNSTATNSLPNSDPLLVSGLLRMNEPGGAFLRHNNPAENRWFSRDVVAIAAVHHLSPVAPYFVDEGALAGHAQQSSPAAYPIGGLTMISFSNNHLVYTLTWFALACMVAGAGFWVVCGELRLR